MSLLGLAIEKLIETSCINPWSDLSFIEVYWGQHLHYTNLQLGFWFKLLYNQYITIKYWIKYNVKIQAHNESATTNSLLKLKAMSHSGTTTKTIYCLATFFRKTGWRYSLVEYMFKIINYRRLKSCLLIASKQQYHK